MRNVVQLWFKCLAANNVLLMCTRNNAFVHLAIALVQKWQTQNIMMCQCLAD